MYRADWKQQELRPPSVDRPGLTMKRFSSPDGDPMTDSIDRLEDGSQRPPPGDPAHFAQVESDDTGEDPARVAEAWKAEIERRVSDSKAGQSGTASCRAVFREARAQLRARQVPQDRVLPS
jgi:hypothetical protein